MNLCDILKTDSERLVQKVIPYAQSRLHFPCIVQEKYDGVYCIAWRDRVEKRCHIFSRTGEEYLSMKHLQNMLYDVLDVADKDLLIFEAYIDNTNQSVISGFCRDTKNQHSELIAYCHDILSLDEYAGTTKVFYRFRFHILCQAISEFCYNKTRIVNNAIAFEEQDILDFANNIWERGGEGCIVRYMNGFYRKGARDYSIMKLKRKISFDLEVIDVKEGTGQFKDKVGKLICRFSNNRTIQVGTGLIKKQRKEWWQDKSLIIGKIVEIEAMRVLPSGLLREPAFKGIRYDKTKADF